MNKDSDPNSSKSIYTITRSKQCDAINKDTVGGQNFTGCKHTSTSYTRCH